MIQTAKAKRTELSKLVEDTHFYTMDLERITLLRDKAFKAFDNEEGKKEWQRYNHILEIMEITLYRLHEIAMNEKKDKK